MSRSRPARLALLGVLVLAAVGCANNCGERRGLFGFRNHASPVGGPCCEGVPCCGPEIPGLPPFGPQPGVNGTLPPAGVSTPPTTGPMPGAIQPGEAQPIPYTPSGGRPGLPARTTRNP